MQDVLLEPYGGQVLHLTVGNTTLLTRVAGDRRSVGLRPCRPQAWSRRRSLPAGGVRRAGRTCSLYRRDLSAPLDSRPLFALGTALIGFGGGLFAHCTLTAAMGSARKGHIGLALGVWGAVQASAAGGAVAAGGLIRDGVGYLALQGRLGPAMENAATGYSVVYHIEIALLFATLIAIGPLVRRTYADGALRPSPAAFGLGEIPTHSLSLPR